VQHVLDANAKMKNHPGLKSPAKGSATTVANFIAAFIAKQNLISGTAGCVRTMPCQ